MQREIYHFAVWRVRAVFTALDVSGTASLAPFFFATAKSNICLARHEMTTVDSTDIVMEIALPHPPPLPAAAPIQAYSTQPGNMPTAVAHVNCARPTVVAPSAYPS
jgi:hypothetical protein